MSRQQRDAFVNERLQHVIAIFAEIENNLTMYKKDDDVQVGSSYMPLKSSPRLLAAEDIGHHEAVLSMIGQMKKETIAIATTGPALLHRSKRQRNILWILGGCTFLTIFLFIFFILVEGARLAH